jgi:hypothetical protein
VTLAIQRKDDIADVSDVYDEDEESRALLQIVERRYRSMLRAVHALLGDTVFRDRESFRLTDEAVDEILVHAAEQVVRISDTTRAAIREQLLLGEKLGLSAWEVAHGVPALNYPGIDGIYMERWKGRADTIARNELAEAAYQSSVSRYRDSGLVDRVQAYDGDDDEPCASRNRRIFKLADAPSRAHVNCTLVLVPILRGEAAP